MFKSIAFSSIAFILFSCQIGSDQESEFQSDNLMESEVLAHIDSSRVKLSFQEIVNACPNSIYLDSSFEMHADLNGDAYEDMAVRFWSKTDSLTGLIIAHGNSSDLFLLGGGEAWSGPINLGWFDELEVIDKGATIAPTLVDSISGDILGSDSRNTILLQTAALKFGVNEACGGGYLYWDGSKYNWMNLE